MIAFYNKQVEEFADIGAGKTKFELAELVKDFIDTDQKKIAWSSSLIDDMLRRRKLTFRRSTIFTAIYRPFCKIHVYYDSDVIHRMGQMPSIFTTKHPNITICTTSAGNRDSFSVTITDVIPDLHMSDKSGAGQCFPIHLYEKQDESNELQFDKSEIIDGYRRRDAITDAILKTFRAAYEKDVSKEDIFYYVYGVLHSPEYRTRFAADLKKMLPRIPLTKETKDFRAFSDAGRKLAEWHLNYETVEPWPVHERNARFPETEPDLYQYYRVTKMNFARPTAAQKASGLKWDKTTIVYNADILIENVPLEAYEYVVNGKPAIEWVMERYQYTRDKDSGIVNDPNDWCKEHKEPRYILDLIKRVVRVSIETMKIVRALPALNERVSS
jgi:predicted helicase